MGLLPSLMRTMRHIENNKKLTTKFWPRMHLLLLVTLIAMALLKEDPLFWRNAGGWPVPLRDFVKLAFYPFFLCRAVSAFNLFCLGHFECTVGSTLPQASPSMLTGALDFTRGSCSDCYRQQYQQRF